jgi:3-phosphoshikimate 1-carboxyvinyltransferase
VSRDQRFEPSGPLQGTYTPPADKSISHRAALFGAMSDEPVVIRNYLQSADTHSTLSALQSLGAGLEEDDQGSVLVRGVGLHAPLEATGGLLDVGNSGTLMRLLPGWLAAQEGRAFALDGDESIRRRPVDRIARPLGLMGARIEARDGRLPPFTVTGARLRGIAYELPVASAQIKSAVALAALAADGPTTIVEPAPNRDHTERMLAAAGAGVRRQGSAVTIEPAERLDVGDELTVPGDPSSAAFAIAAALIVPGARVVVRGASTNWTRTGFVRIAQRMGGRIEGEIEDAPGDRIPLADPIGDLDVGAGPLRATVVEPEEVPLAIDELPLVALLGCFAEGETVVRGAAELRVKESDRIATVVDGLTGLGGDIEPTDDGFVVRGTGGLRGGTIASHGDHRLAMLGAVAGLASREGVDVVGMDAAAVSYPTFETDVGNLAG